MKHYLVRRYEPKDFAPEVSEWNAFISSAKNATFLFHRDFMDYHSDRFDDFSLLIFEDGKLVSVLPANRAGDTVYSHQGLTYGGFVFTEKVKLTQVLEIVKATLKFLHSLKIETLQLKLIPSIYNCCFAEEVEYAMFLTESKLIRRDCLSVIDLTKPFAYSTLRKRGIAKGVKNNLIIKEEQHFDSFWNDILIPNLDKKHDAKPVHTVGEIIQLQRDFPNNIRQFNVYYNDKIVAGTTVFETESVLHAQYISGNEQKNELGSLDFLFHYLITDVFKDKKYFDFGISQEKNGRSINDGLLYWKESFGARTVVQNFYAVQTANYQFLENVLI